MKFGVSIFFEILSRNFKLHSNVTRITVLYFTWRSIYLYNHISLNFFLECEIFWTKSVEKIKKKHIMFNNLFFSGNFGRYEVMWKNNVEPYRPQMTIRGMRIACWITKAKHTHTHTHTHSEYVIVIAFPLQQRLHKSAPKLRHTCFLIWVDVLEHSSWVCMKIGAWKAVLLLWTWIELYSHVYLNP